MSAHGFAGEALALAALVMFSANIVTIRYALGRLDVNAGFLISISVNAAFALLAFVAQLALRTPPLHWHAAVFSCSCWPAPSRPTSAAGSFSSASPGWGRPRRARAR